MRPFLVYFQVEFYAERKVVKKKKNFHSKKVVNQNTTIPCVFTGRAICKIVTDTCIEFDAGSKSVKKKRTYILTTIAILFFVQQIYIH